MVIVASVILANMTDKDILANMTDKDILANMTDKDILANMTDKDILANMTDKDILANMTDKDIIFFQFQIAIFQVIAFFVFPFNLYKKFFCVIKGKNLNERKKIIIRTKS